MLHDHPSAVKKDHVDSSRPRLQASPKLARQGAGERRAMPGRAIQARSRVLREDPRAPWSARPRRPIAWVA